MLVAIYINMELLTIKAKQKEDTACLCHQYQHLFDYLNCKIEQDLVRAAEICREIRGNRNVGHEHKQLDALENSLADGPSFIRREHRKVLDIDGEDVDGGDGMLSC